MADRNIPRSEDDRGAVSLPPPPTPFKGRIGSTYEDSVPDYSTPPSLESAPNVLLILLDDVGFGHPSTLGGPIEMPTFQRIADNGLLYNRFHTTAICAPTRAALLTGRNHHNVGAGAIPEMATGYPGYDAHWPKECASIAQVLRLNGYSTAAFGKWHNTPEWEINAAGPFERWPTGLGFEYFYGFLGGDCDHWNPTLYENTRLVDLSNRSPSYHLDRDLADRAIDWIQHQHSVVPDRPFFVYYAPGSAHSPHHAPRSWMDHYAGSFDHGWDEQRVRTYESQVAKGIIPADAALTERPAEIPAWSSFSDDEQLLATRLMEAFAGQLSHCDVQIGRLLEEIEDLGQLQNTLIIYIAGDNGPAPEGNVGGQLSKWGTSNGVPDSTAAQLDRIDEIGGPLSYPIYPIGWAWAGATPFQWFKQVASHLGGTRNGTAISWPQGIPHAPSLRGQFHHVIDIFPTILDAANIPVPRSVNGVVQLPLEGESMYSSFESSSVTGRRQQFFEVVGNRAFYRDGWLASARHDRLPWDYASTNPDFESDRWELFDLEADFSQARDLAPDEPEKLRLLRGEWFSYAERNNVFPLDDRMSGRIQGSGRPNPLEGVSSFHYLRGFRERETSSPNLKGRSHNIWADITVEAFGAEGVLVTSGGRFGGYGLYLRDGFLHYVHNFCGFERYTVKSDIGIEPGIHRIGMEFRSDREERGSGGNVRLLFDANIVGRGRVERTVPNRYSYCETFDVGEDSATPIDESYECPFRFDGVLHGITIEIV